VLTLCSYRASRYLRGGAASGREQVAPHSSERFDLLTGIPCGRGYCAGVIFVDEVVQAVADEIYGARGILGVIEDFFHVEAEREELCGWRFGRTNRSLGTLASGRHGEISIEAGIDYSVLIWHLMARGALQNQRDFLMFYQDVIPNSERRTESAHHRSKAVAGKLSAGAENLD
jgi:hypothetical protein